MKLVSEYTGWRDHLRWWSLRIAWLTAALNVAWMQIPDDLKATAPEWTMQVLTALMMVGIVIGRLVDQGEENPDG